MARYYGQDVRNSIVSLLGDSSSGFNATISTINTERSQSAPSAKSIDYKWSQNQHQFIFVDLDEDEVVYDDAAIGLNLDTLPVTYKVFVMGVVKGATDNLQNWCEDWIEAVIRVLHNYNDTNIHWIAYISTDRSELYKIQNEVIRTFNVTFEVRIGG